uniref:Uncharacterized protein n=1 Tax=Glossina pallidipes TaxID=7398 RepID=A0A1B0AJI5_GLOPL
MYGQTEIPDPIDSESCSGETAIQRKWNFFFRDSFELEVKGRTLFIDFAIAKVRLRSETYAYREEGPHFIGRKGSFKTVRSRLIPASTVLRFTKWLNHVKEIVGSDYDSLHHNQATTYNVRGSSSSSSKSTRE